MITLMELFMITQKELKEEIYYDKESGKFYRLPSFKEIKVKENKDGHIRFRVKNTRYFAHRLAWIYTYGEILSETIDHINGNPSDNRLSNLRQASRKENSRNSKMFSSNSSGVKGVYWHKNKKCWYAHCRVNNIRHFVGLFKNIKDAEIAVNTFRELYHGEFANHGK